MKDQKSKTELAVPKISQEVIEQLQSDNDELRASGIINVTKLVLPQIPPDYVFKPRDRQFVENSVLMAFDLVGGVPRLVKYADENYDKFVPLMARLLPEAKKHEQAPATIQIFNAVPASPLDLGQYGDVIDDLEDSDE